MANYEQKIFEQVIDSYFVESQTNLPAEEEKKLNIFPLKDTSNDAKEENTCTKKTETQKKKRESKSKAVLIEAEYHENLPEGWKKVVVQRTTGATAGKYDVYFFTPSGRKLRSKNEIKDYSDKHELELDLTKFGFSRPRREKTVAKTPCKKSKSKSCVTPVDKDSNSASVDMCDSSNNLDTSSNSFCDDVSLSINGDSCISVDNLLSNIDEEDIKSLTEVLETPVELDLPNTSFTKSSATPPRDDATGAAESVHFDIDQSHLGKTFKIERPLSFSCF